MINESKERKLSNGIITILLVILFIISILILSYFYYKYWNTTALSFIEILCFSSQIIGGVFVTISVIIAVFQYYLSLKATKNDLKIIQIQKAVDLSQYYKDEILPYISAIKYIYDNTGANNILGKISINQINEFTEDELNKLLNSDERTELQNIASRPKFYETALAANEIYNLGLNPMYMPNAEGKDSITIPEDAEKKMGASIARLITKTLNNLEYFSLHFSHNSADSSVIYQSLHQTFFIAVTLLYYQIAKENNDPTEKYYTNIVWLFKNWKNINAEKKKAKDVELSKLEHHGSTIVN